MKRLALILGLWAALCVPALAQFNGGGFGQPGFTSPKVAAGGAAPFALDGTPVFTNSASSNALQVGSAITTSFANSLILVPIITNDTGGVTSVTDGVNTYARVPGLTPALASGTTVDCWYAIAAAAGTYQPTMHTAVAAFATIGVIGVSGTKTSSIFETPVSTTTGTNATFTTVNNNTFMLGVDVAGTSSVSNGFTNLSTTGVMVVDYKIETVTRSGYVYDATNGTSSLAVAAIKGP